MPTPLNLNIALELDACPLQDGFDVGPNRFEPFFAHDLDDGFARDIGGLTSHHLRVGPADELVAQVTAAAGQHERRLVDHQFKVGLPARAEPPRPVYVR